MTSNYVAASKEDTYALLWKAQKGDEEAKRKLIEQNTGLVRSIAMKFLSAEYDMDDLMQIGYLGLWKAIEHFDPGYDVMFSTYAVPVIMGELKRFFRDHGKIKVSRLLKTEIHMVKQMQADFVAKEGVQPRVSQIARALAMTPERVLEVLEASEQLQNIDSLDDQIQRKAYESSGTIPSPEQQIDKMMMKEGLATLKPREQQVIILRYYRDMTQQEIARILNISQVQVSRIEKKTIEKLRKQMGIADI
ncbi:MAG: sigma-70 family RNA polymerase sigma factor [Firmicutes bacterium]|nr:sigma-70 family RNA polymerase sigma factor [Bacillota bacterium]